MRRSIPEVRAELERRRASYEKQKRRRRMRLLGALPVLIVAVVLTVGLVPWSDMLAPADPPTAPAEPTSPNPDYRGEPMAPMDPGDPPKGNETITPPLDVNMGGLYGDACYSDSVDSFEELLEAAELIVIGTVVDSIDASYVAQTATVRVDSTYRAYGETPLTEIRLYQLKDGNTVSVGRTYLLFLKKQSGDDDNAFYSVGGAQGRMTCDAGGASIGVSDARIDEQAVLAWLKDRTPIQ